MSDSEPDQSKKELKEKLSILKDQGGMVEPVNKRIDELEKLKQKIPIISSHSQFQSFLKLFKVLGNKNRLLILWLIMNGVRCACEIEHLLGLSQSTVSHHLNELIEIGALDVIKSGKWSIVSTDSKTLKKEFFENLIEKNTG